MSISPSRALAFDALKAVIFDHQKPEDMLSQGLNGPLAEKLKKPDRGLVKELLYGSLRWYKKLHWVAQKLSRRRLDHASPEIQVALVGGLHQILHLDRIPHRAAVNESVEYLRARGQERACSFVNGILRAALRNPHEIKQGLESQKTRLAGLSLIHSHPEWMVGRWAKRYSETQLVKLLSSNNKAAPTTIRVNGLKYAGKDIREFQQLLLKEERLSCEKRPLKTALQLAEAFEYGPESLFARGHFTVQDESAQLIAHLIDYQDAHCIVDACAGPGGKFSQLFELKNPSAMLIGTESKDSQADKLVLNMERLGVPALGYILLRQEFQSFNPKALGFPEPDRILLDAPCTGMGVLRRHPEAKWRKTPESLKELARTQKTLLWHALSILKLGGELVYSVCSFEPEESQEQLKSLLQAEPAALELISLLDRLPPFYRKFVGRDHLLQIRSGNDEGMDGFSAFVIKKKAPLKQGS